ncbi:hypothetical protein [Actinoallomurus rhizosphaericola]|uniref:hypothetical protein n=1 Tax=Actinoallomurus rhizosphaericola TaxID=2952536 RepID=UPI00209244C5|nr:hypothetical protein [Actinoallomurus rhizosphaericola]MCO5997326.1 hypothetical protein [Actinoallomurus rhizosphaericola]
MTAPFIVGASDGSPTLAAAEHLLHRLFEEFGRPAGAIGCTHLVRLGRPHVAVSLTVSAVPEEVLAGLGAACEERRWGPADLAEAAAQAAREHAGRSAGRAVFFPGAERVTGSLNVGEVLAASAIDEVVVLGGGPPGPADRFDARGHVRPEWRSGRLTLAAMPGGGDVLVPFEVADPTPCCADHA